MVLNFYRNHNTYWGLGEGGRGSGGGGRGRQYTYHYTVGSDESHFNVSLIVKDQVTRQCPQTTVSLNCNLFEEKGELKWNQAEALLLTSLTLYC